jgi:hypothetical protein
MATQIAHPVQMDSAIRERRADGTGGRILAWLKQMYCGLHGHDNLMHFEKDRVFLQCASCGHQTPGWTLTETAPRVLFHGDARRHAIAKPQLVRARRIA